MDLQLNHKTGLVAGRRKGIGAAIAMALPRAPLAQARNFLVSTSMPISSFANRVGFARRNHFSRAFRNAFGTDPTSRRWSGLNESQPIRAERSKISVAEPSESGEPSAASHARDDVPE